MHAPERFLEGDAERVARHMGLGDATPHLESVDSDHRPPRHGGEWMWA